MFSFSQEATLVKKATAPSDEPTPGYVFHELVGLTQKSVESSQKLQDLLLERLEKDSPVIKLKSLRVIKHLLLKAHPSFKRELATRVDQIRPALNYRGPPDPLHGDSPYQMVRTEAQDVVNMLFTTDQASYSSSSASFSDDYSKKSIGSTGIKSDNFGAMATISKAKDDLISNTLDLKNKITAKIYANSGPTTFRHSELSNFGGFGSPGSYTPTQPTTTPTTQHEAGRPGGDWAAYNNDNHNKSRYNDDEESVLVEEFTASSGIPSPSFSVVSQFCNRCASLDPYRISELLYDKISGSRAWQSKQKAVVAIEALLQGSGSAPYAEFFSNNYEAIATLTTSVHAVTREKAKKALSFLAESNPDIADAVNAPASVSSAQATYTPDPSSQQPQSPQPTNSLFEGLSLSDNVPSATTPTSPVRTTTTRAQRPPVQAAAPRNTTSLISLLDDSEAPAPPPTQATSPHTPSQPLFNFVGGDPFDPLGPSSTAPTAAHVTTPVPPSTVSQPATTSPNTNTSSFDDLLSLSTPSAAPPQQPQYPYNNYKPAPYSPQQQSIFFRNPSPVTPMYAPPPNGYTPMRPNMMAGSVPIGPAAQHQQNSSSDSFNFVNNTKKDAFGDLVTQQKSNINTK